MNDMPRSFAEQVEEAARIGYQHYGPCLTQTIIPLPALLFGVQIEHPFRFYSLSETLLWRWVRYDPEREYLLGRLLMIAHWLPLIPVPPQLRRFRSSSKER